MKKAIWKIQMQYFTLDRENITKYGKADRPRSRQTAREGGREGGNYGVQCGKPSSCPKQNRQPNTVTFPNADELIGISWDDCLLLYY